MIWEMCFSKFLYFVWSGGEAEERDRSSRLPSAGSSPKCRSWDWACPQPGARNSIWVGHLAGEARASPWAITSSQVGAGSEAEVGLLLRKCRMQCGILSGWIWFWFYLCLLRFLLKIFFNKHLVCTKLCPITLSFSLDLAVCAVWMPKICGIKHEIELIACAINEDWLVQWSLYRTFLKCIV